MAVNIYDELTALSARIAKLEAMHAPKAVVAPVSYFFPGTKWDTMLAKKPALALINPGSGPGTSQSGSYVAQVGRCKTAGVPVYGYVYTDYGNRPAADVKRDIDLHYLWYGVNGIFLDEASNVIAPLPYYTDLYYYIKGKNGTVVLNPGTKTLEQYASVADHLMVSETDLVTYRGQTRPAWEANYPASKFWHCVHTCPVGDMPGVVALAKQRNAGLIYVTADVMPNPYDTLPTYWDALCAEVAKL